MSNADAQKLIDEAQGAADKTTVGKVNKHWKVPPAGSQWATHDAKLAQARSALDPIVGPSTLGTKLRKWSAAPGTRIEVISLAELVKARDTAADGTIIDCGGLEFDLKGGTFAISTARTVAKLTEIRNPKLTYGGANGCLRLQGSTAGWIITKPETAYGVADGIKATDNARDFLIDAPFSHDNIGQGYLTSGATKAWTVRNPTFDNNGGTTSTLDHSAYLGSGDSLCEFLNAHSLSPAGYGIQIQYASTDGILVSMPTVDGGGDSTRGGIVFALGATRNRVIGAAITRCATGAVQGVQEGARNVVESSYQWGNGAGFVAASGIKYIDPHDGKPGVIPDSLLPYVTPLDHDGKARPATGVKAGAFA